MADSAFAAQRAADMTQVVEEQPAAPHHSLTVRITHWITAICFLALLVTGIEVLISHPRFYWGETGNVNMPALFEIPIPASRDSVQTGYGFVLPDQNGWSRALHFQTAWIAVFTGIAYVLWGLLSGHFRRNLVPHRAEVSREALLQAIADHLRPQLGTNWAYNVLQKAAYLGVIFVLFPLMIWTGLAMSPGVASALPGVVSVLGGQQSARTIHFFATSALVLFLAVHVVMVIRTGFRKRVGAMISGSAAEETE